MSKGCSFKICSVGTNGGSNPDPGPGVMPPAPSVRHYCTYLPGHASAETWCTPPRVQPGSWTCRHYAPRFKRRRAIVARPLLVLRACSMRCEEHQCGTREGRCRHETREPGRLAQAASAGGGRLAARLESAEARV